MLRHNGMKTRIQKKIQTFYEGTCSCSTNYIGEAKRNVETLASIQQITLVKQEEMSKHRVMYKRIQIKILKIYLLKFLVFFTFSDIF